MIGNDFLRRWNFRVRIWSHPLFNCLPRPKREREMTVHLILMYANLDSSFSLPPQNLFPSVYRLLITHTFGSASITNHRAIAIRLIAITPYRGELLQSNPNLFEYSAPTALAFQLQSLVNGGISDICGGHSRVNAIWRQTNCAIWKDIAILHQQFKALSISNMHPGLLFRVNLQTMAPSTIVQPQPAAGSVDSLPGKSKVSTRPLKNSGSLDAFKHFDSTPAIGREYPESQLAEWITSPKADALLRDLAITSTCLFKTDLTHSFWTRGGLLSQSKGIHTWTPKDSRSAIGRVNWKTRDQWPSYPSRQQRSKRRLCQRKRRSQHR